MRTRTSFIPALAAGSVAVLALAACSANAAAPSSSGGAPAELDTVTVQLDFQPRGLHSTMFVTDEKGFFAEEGIEIEQILPGTSSGDTLRLVGSGQGDFGMADLPTLVVAQSQEIPVQAIGAVNQTSPLAMCTLADEHTLESPADLEGLTVGVQASGSTYVFYKALLATNGVDASALTELTVQPPYEQYLLTGQVDTVPCYVDAEITILEEHAGGEGSLSVLRGPEWGYDAYGTGVFTSDRMIAEDPELVQRFMNAYVKGLQYVIDNPREAAEILAASAPDRAQNVDLYERQIQADIEETFTSVDGAGLAGMTDDTWAAMVEMLAAQGVIETSPAVEDLADASFVTQANEQ
ncbi:ABC transporter substrate-binding protein [Agrococcus beijingensis]|uniref:ABC transporter substrate-binding protein n=1 Tax=Agrococcus beijingensis TaxID=3068634 RepID=UPI0027429554|nr:ABC transporter substrate-binding protein [Agrococcus sp. REN33]